MSRYIVQTVHAAAGADGNGTVLTLLRPGEGAYTQVSVQVQGVTSATLTFQGSNDGTNYHAYDLVAVGVMETPVNQVTANGMWRGEVVAQYFRVVISSFVTGSITVTVTAVAQ